MKKFLIGLLVTVLILSVLSVSGGLIAYAAITKDAVLNEDLLPKAASAATFYDAVGNKISGSNDGFATYEELPENLKNAVVALEDKRFYTHKGVDYIRLGGAAVNNVKKGNFSEGGSTITQQLIKNTHLTQDKTVNRKLNEIKLAKQLEKKYDKNEILTMYLNVVYFGGGMYGVKAAAKGYFNKNVDSLSLAECATLAAILKNPSKYSPAANAENAKTRRNLVLSLMYEQNYISENEKLSAQAENVTLDKSATFSNTQSYTLSAAYEAAKILNISYQTLIGSDYKITTYLNTENQRAITDVIGNPAYYVLNENGVRGEGLAIILDNKTAGVSAYFSTKKRNIYDFSRPFGSTVKPVLVYAPALQNKLITAATPVLDELTDFSGYTPENYKNEYLGWTDIRTAIKYSSNVAAVKTYNAVGFDNVKTFAASVGITLSDADNNSTVALGNLSSDNTLLSLTGAYCTLANGGYYTAPTFIKSITDGNGNVVYSHNPQTKSVISAENAYIMTDILVDTATCGTAKGLKDIGFEVAAKTGTVGNDFGNTDAYNVGYTTDNTYLVWHGNSTGDKINDLPLNETGGSYATRSARDILKNIYKASIPQGFAAPAGITVENIDLYALKNKQLLRLATENTPAEYIKTEIFSYDNAPTEYSKCFDGYSVDNVQLTIENNIVTIQYDAAEYLYYDVSRLANDKEKLLAEFAPSAEKYSFTDIAVPYNTIVKYSIKPYFYNQNGIKIVGDEYVTDEIYLKYDFIDYNDY